MDIVFVHGLGGSARATWMPRATRRGEAFFWPSALAQDLTMCGVWSIEYAAPVTTFALNPGMTVDDRAANVALRLCNSGLGSRPLVFVMHSLGGLIIKSLCVQSHFGNEDVKLIASSVRGLVFCGTPHRGSAIATAAQMLGDLSARHLKELRLNTDRLNRAHRDFLAWHKSRPDVEVQTYFETIGFAHRQWWLPAGRKLLVVSQTSADTGIVGSPMHPVGADHQQLVKPKSRDAEIYGGVRRFILDRVTGSATVEQVLTTTASIGATNSIGEAKGDIPSNIPPAGVFVGRARELGRIRDALKNSKYPAICIRGLGGFGKTALALESVSRCLSVDPEDSSWPAFEAYFWVSARGRVVTLSDVLSTIAKVLDQPGVGTQPLNDQAETIYKLLRRSRCLLILDNFETVTDEAVEEFVLGIPHPSKVLITSRESRLKDAFYVPIAGLDEDDYFELLLAEGHRLNLPALGSEKRADLLAVHEATGGAPLAIKWAVAQVGQLGQGLDSVIASISDARGDIFEKIFNRSWQLLDTVSSLLLSTMPIFATDASRPAIEITCGIQGIELDQALAQVVALNLVDATNAFGPGERRYAIHALTRAFVQSKRALRPEALRDAQARVADWFAHFSVERAGQPSRVDSLVPELQNILKSMRWCYEHKVWEPLARCSIALREFLPDTGHWNEALELGGLGIEAAQALNDRYHVGRLCIIPMGWVYRYREELDTARQWYERGLQAFIEVGDADRAAWARLALANILLRSGQAEQGREMAEEVRDSGAGDTVVRKQIVYAAALIHLSEMAFHRSEFTVAAGLASEARQLSLETGYKNSTMSASYWLGMAYLRLGALGEAERYLSESQELNTKDNVRMGVALCHAAIAELRYRQGNSINGSKYAEHARRLFERLGMRRELSQLQLALELLERPQGAT